MRTRQVVETRDEQSNSPLRGHGPSAEVWALAWALERQTRVGGDHRGGGCGRGAGDGLGSVARRHGSPQALCTGPSRSVCHRAGFVARRVGGPWGRFLPLVPSPPQLLEAPRLVARSPSLSPRPLPWEGPPQSSVGTVSAFKDL